MDEIPYRIDIDEINRIYSELENRRLEDEDMLNNAIKYFCNKPNKKYEFNRIKQDIK
jgi:hypothetical protein